MLRRTRPRRALATVLFTDIVGSTERAAQLGDAGWRALLAQHHRAIRRALRRHGGHEVDTAGDGFFATFAQPADAIACALESADAVASLGIELRAGIHTGEVEPMGQKVGGIAVHLGARILGSAEPGQIVVSSTVRELVSGSGLAFRDLGSRSLKGVADEWHLFAVERPIRVGPAAVPDGAAPASSPARRRYLLPAAMLALAILSSAAAFILARELGAPAAASTVDVLRAIGTDGSLGDAIGVGQGPGSVAVADGAVWVANTQGGTVSRVDPDRGEDAVVGADVPTDIAASNGLIWVLDPFASTVSVLDGEDATLLQAISVHGRAIAATEDAVWVADDITDVVHRIDPQSRGIVDVIALPTGSGPSAIAADADAVWVVNGLAGTVARIDAATNEVVVEALALSRHPTAVAAGNGIVWVVSATGDAVLQIDPDTNRVVGQERGCDRPTDVSVAGEDAIVICSGDQTVQRFRGADEASVITPIDGVPIGLAVDGDRVWVTIRGS